MGSAPHQVVQSPRRVPKEEGTSWGSGGLGSRPGSVTELLLHPWQVISLTPILLNRCIGLDEL